MNAMMPEPDVPDESDEPDHERVAPPVTESVADQVEPSAPPLSELGSKGESTIDDATAGCEAIADSKPSVWVVVKNKLVEPSPKVVLADRRRLALASRRDFILYSAGVGSAALGLWWLLPDEIKSKFGLKESTDPTKDHFLKNVRSFDDAVAKGLYSSKNAIPTYSQKDKTEVPNNYAGQTPDVAFLGSWKLKLIGAKGSPILFFSTRDLQREFTAYAEITRLVCVEGWSAITEWGGVRLSDFIRRYPPSQDCRWLQLRSDVNLDSDGNSDPYFVSIDLQSALHPQTLLAMSHNGSPLELEHGAPLRLIAPMKLGLKNIKAITSIEYCKSEPTDYWNQYGYSYYDGI